MGKIVELPLLEPIYSTYHYGLYSACIVSNPTIRNHYLNEVLILECNPKFLSGYTSPQINLEGTAMYEIPCLIKHKIDFKYLNGYVNCVIRNMIDEGYYVYFTGIDDFYVEGKSWYKEKHHDHDGGICGYNQEDKTYCIYAYDSNWIYRKFWTPQKAFEKGRLSMFKREKYGYICGIKPVTEKVEFSPKKALEKICEYLESKGGKNSENEDIVRGIAVHDYIAKYVSMLYDGSIPYERMDRRVFRMIWEHKKVMLERIQLIEESLGMDSDISQKYEPLVHSANSMRMAYAMHNKKRRDSVLVDIEQKLLELKEKEFQLLTELLKKTKYLLK